MKHNLFANIRKRIILVVVGIAGYYLIPVPIGIVFNMLTHELLTSFWAFYVFKGMALTFLVGFLYLALVKVKPSLVPLQAKYRNMIIAGIVVITILSILIPSGLIVDNWRQGQCLIKSGTVNENGRFSGTTSSGVGSESECIQHCKFSGRVSMDEEKLCEFNGMFGSAHWLKTPKDFADIDSIPWNG